MRYIIIAVLSIVFIFLERPEYLYGKSFLTSVTYHFFHANIFHLAANCLSVWYLFKKTITRNAKTMIAEILIAYIIATFSYMVAFRPIIGVSNMLFAIIGMRTPAWSSSWWRAKETKLFFGITLFMLLFPQVSAITHITAFIIGVIVSMTKRKIKSLENDYRRATYK